MSKKTGEEVRSKYMGAKAENKPQVMGTQFEPYSSSVKPHAFNVSRFYRQIAGMVEPGQASRVNFCVPTARDLSNFRRDLSGL